MSVYIANDSNKSHGDQSRDGIRDWWYEWYHDHDAPRLNQGVTIIEDMVTDLSHYEPIPEIRSKPYGPRRLHA